MSAPMPSISAPPSRTGFVAVLARELSIIAHSPFYTLFIFILPLSTFVVLGAVFYNESPRDMPIVVCDNDNSSLSRQLTRMADSAAALSVVATVQDMSEGSELVRRGKAYAVIYIPNKLEQDVKRGEAPAVTAYFNNQWLLTSGLISRALREVAGSLSAKIDVGMRMKKGETPSEAREHYEPIRLDLHLLFNPNLNYRYYLLPALFPTMVQAFIIMVSVRVFGGELKHGTAGQWLAVSGGSPWIAFSAKALPYSICFMGLTAFMVAVLLRLANVPLHGSLWVIASASFLFVLSYQALGFLLVGLTGNLRMANSLAGFVAGPAFAFAGITYPTVGMPPVAKFWGGCLPLTHYLHIVLEQIFRGAPPQASGHALLALVLFAAIPPVLVMRRMARMMRDPQCWGRL